MNILHITDSHGAPVAPKNRSDMYYITFLKKLLEIEYVIKKENIDLVLHTGDLFHRSRVSNKFMGQTAVAIKRWSAPLYVVPGNHDIDGYNLGTIDQTSLGLLARTGVIHLLTRNTPLRFKKDDIEVAISGQEYYKDIDTGIEEDFEMQQDAGDINILAIHGYVANTQQHPDIRCTYVKDIVTDADIVLSGHYHESFFEERSDGISFYNPGSMMRVEANTYNRNHMPQYGILSIDKDANGDVEYKYTFHKFTKAEPFDKVFNQVSIEQRNFNITLDKFKESITDVIQNITGIDTSTSSITEIENYIKVFCSKNADANESMMLTRANYIYNSAVQQTQNEDNVVVGFIPSQDVIKIKSIDIHNFQAHTDTHIDFSDGLNIITGESNNGKSSILRAIDWVTDNYPLGNEFIQTGKKDCKVRITYSNNTFIERYRTIKSTGYYRVGTVLDDGTEEYEQYEGFTNNVPIEVINTHQMPKVAITKNIETHLNKIGQLEPAFLITDSVNEKAAAIGKITGTDVIDTGIKLIGSEILNTKKEIKQLEEDIAQTTAKKESIDIEAVKQRLDMLNTLEEQYKKHQKLLDDANKIEEEYDDLTQELETSKQKIALFNRVLDNKDAIASITNTFDNIQIYTGLLREYIDKNEELSKEQYTIKMCTEIINNKPEIEKVSKSIDIVKQLLKILNDYNDAISEVENYKTKIQSITETTSKSKEDIESIKKDMYQFIIDSKVCPCCGQEVSEEHIPSIIKMLKG